MQKNNNMKSSKSLNTESTEVQVEIQRSVRQQEEEQQQQAQQQEKKSIMKSPRRSNTESTEAQVESQGNVKPRIRAIEQGRMKKNEWIEVDWARCGQMKPPKWV